MKNKQFLFLFLIMFFGFFNNKAQNIVSNDDFNPLEKTNISERSFYKHDIGVSCGLFAAPIILPIPYLPSIIPTLNLDYHYNFNAKHSIGFSYSISTDFPFPLSKWLNKNYLDDHPEDKDLFTSSIYNSLQIGYRMNFVETGKFTFYFSVYAGIDLVSYNIKNKEKPNLLPLPSLHIAPLGFTYGEKNKFNFEFGIGSRGLINIGYRYSFNK